MLLSIKVELAVGPPNCIWMLLTPLVAEDDRVLSLVRVAAMRFPAESVLSEVVPVIA